MRLDYQAYQVLSTAAERHSTLREILGDFDGDPKLRLEMYFETLAETGLVEFYPLEGPVKQSTLSL
jgi:hypothetical protein